MVEFCRLFIKTNRFDGVLLYMDAIFVEISKREKCRLGLVSGLNVF